MIQLRNIGLVLASPVKGFGALLQRPRCALAVMLLVACAIVAHVAVHDRIDVAAQQRLTAAELEQPGQEVSDEEVVKTAAQALNLRRIGGYAVYLVGVPLGLLVMTLVFWLAYAAWSEGLGFRRCFRLVAHVWLPFGLRQLLSLPVIFSYPSIDPASTWGLFKTNLGALPGPAAALPGAFLVDPFWIWMGVLSGLAGRAMGRGRIWSTVIGVLFWLLFAFAGRSL